MTLGDILIRYSKITTEKHTEEKLYAAFMDLYKACDKNGWRGPVEASTNVLSDD